MLRKATPFLLILLLAAGTVRAQEPIDVTVRELNAIPQTQLDELIAGGTGLQLADIQARTLNDFQGETVRFTGVVLSDPLNSGLSTPTDGFPSRVHFFVRDTTAASAGPEGMTIQVVNGGDYQSDGTLLLSVGSVVEIVGLVGGFSGAIQVSPETITDLGLYSDLGLPDSILDPVSITTADAVMPVDGGVQINWENLNDLNGQYVRIENATVVTRDISTDRPNWIITTDGGETVLNFYDISLRYRNDREGTYDETVWNVRDDDFVPPPPGSVINVNAFVYFNGSDDPFVRAVPQGALMSFVPMEDDDIEITETPPEASQASKPTAVPAAGEAVTVTTEVTADPARTIDSVTLTYFTSADATEMTVPMASTGKVGDVAEGFAAEIPGQDDGVFVIYNVTAVDNTGASFTSRNQDYRVLADGIDEIADLQEPSGYTGSNGDYGPFAGMTTAMNLTVTIMNDPAVNGREYAAQDDPDLNPWTGIYINPTSELTADLHPGDVINITEALVYEDFDVTQLRDLVYTTVTEGGDRLPFKEVTTDVLQDVDIAEAHEGMALIFEDVVITSTNPDAPGGPFGEWAFSSDGTEENQLRADDRSNGIDFGAGQDAGTFFQLGSTVDFIRGILYYSFGNYKLMPDDLTNDVGDVISTANEDLDVPNAFALRQNYPNPFNPATSIQYAVPTAGHVRLEVFDLLGRSVATLVDGALTPGTYTARFDARDLASGVYLYRLTAGSQTTTRTMLLLK